MLKQRVAHTYMQTPQYDSILKRGFRLVKDYPRYCLFEKVDNGTVLYRECFHKFELYGASWANSPKVNAKAIGSHYKTKGKKNGR